MCFTPLLHDLVCLMSLHRLAGVCAQGEHHIFITHIVIHQHKDHALSKNHRKSKCPNDSGKSGNTHLLAFCSTKRWIEIGTRASRSQQLTRVCQLRVQIQGFACRTLILTRLGYCTLSRLTKLSSRSWRESIIRVRAAVLYSGVQAKMERFVSDLQH